MKRFITIFFIALTLVHASVAGPSFGRAVNYPHIGLMLPPLEHAKARPLPMPDAHAFIVEEPGALLREDRFDPYQLWYADQCEGRWQDTQGNTLIIGRIKTALPQFIAEYVCRDHYSLVSADGAWQIDARNPEQIHEWAANFSGQTLFEPESLRINSMALSSIYAYAASATNTLVYAFHPRRIGNARNFDWFCVTLHCPGAHAMAKIRSDFERDWLGAVAQPSATARETGAAAAELDTSRRGVTAFDQPHHPVRIAARKSIANYAAWWHAETDGYIILSDINTDLGRTLVKRVQREMPIFLGACRQLLPPLTVTRDIALIRIFQFKSDYDTYVGERYKWSGGIWMPRRRELVLTQESHAEETLSTLRHESFHQYISYAWGMLTPSPWLNEGHACFFENAHIDSKGEITFDEDPKRVRTLLDNLDAATAMIPGMLDMDYDEFYHGGGTAAGRALHYALAWGVAYYLQKGAPQERNTPFKSLLSDYAAALTLTRDFQEANALAFADVDIKVFQSNFQEFWLKRRASAMRYDPLSGK